MSGEIFGNEMANENDVPKTDQCVDEQQSTKAQNLGAEEPLKRDMAEPSNLDDFFAKKDKSKKSKSKKYASTDVLVKQSDESGAKKSVGTNVDKSARNKDSGATVTTSTMILEQDDDEWREIEEKEVDLSGLKIQNLQIGDLKDEELDRERSDSHSEDGDPSRSRDSHGPWKVQATPQVVAVKEPEPEKEKVPEAPADQKYRAPHARTPLVKAATKLRSKTAPELSSDLDFPALSEGPKQVKVGPKKGVSDVSRSSDVGRRAPQVDSRFKEHQPQDTRPRLNLAPRTLPLTQRNLS